MHRALYFGARAFANAKRADYYIREIGWNERDKGAWLTNCVFGWAEKVM